MSNIYDAFERVLKFSSGEKLTEDIARLEAKVKSIKKDQVAMLIDKEDFGASSLHAALSIKKVAGQINVIIHAIGIINALPYILETDEVIEYVSLGAGNTGKEFDLVTNKRVAEFKFINWKGADTIRQNNTFKDFFNLVEYETHLRKCLYLLDKSMFIRFMNNNRSLESVLSKNMSIHNRFRKLYGDKYAKVSDYYKDKHNQVEVSDLNALCGSIFDIEVF
jgi:hypothetical protein